LNDINLYYDDWCHRVRKEETVRIEQEDDMDIAKTAVIFTGKTLIWVVADIHSVFMTANVACGAHSMEGI
jgi:hypothetical protein